MSKFYKCGCLPIFTKSLSEREGWGIEMVSPKECSFLQVSPDNWKCHPEHHDHVDSYRRLLRQDIKRLKPWTIFSEKDQTFSVYYLFYFSLFLFKPEVNSATAHICRPVVSSKSLNSSKPVKTKLAIWLMIFFSLAIVGKPGPKTQTSNWNSTWKQIILTTARQRQVVKPLVENLKKKL